MGAPVKAPKPAEVDVGIAPALARIRDYWLEGEHHTDADRVLAQEIELCWPHIPYLVRAQRALVRRQVRYLVAAGVTQFLDLGSGLPAQDYVHHTAQRAEPSCRVVYVDADRSIEVDSRRLLAETDRADFVVADCRDATRLLADPRIVRTLDPSRPYAVLMSELLLHIPEGDDPAALVAGYVEAMPPGSYLALSHLGGDEQVREGLRIFARLGFGPLPDLHLRSLRRVTGFFAGLELVEPGVVPVPLWRPDPTEELTRNPGEVRMYAGLGRKPVSA